MESDCLTPKGKECAARFVCGSDIKLYSTKCMQYLKVMDDKGLSGSGDKLEQSDNTTAEKDN